MWLCLTEFNKIRQDESISVSVDDKYKEAEKYLFDWRNLEVCRATSNFEHSHFSVAIKNLQSLTDELRVSQAFELSQLKNSDRSILTESAENSGEIQPRVRNRTGNFNHYVGSDRTAFRF